MERDEVLARGRIPRGAPAVVAGVGIALLFLGLFHFAAMPLVLKANRVGGFALPSIEETGFRYALNREGVLYGLMLAGVDRVIFGVLILLCVPALRDGKRLAWRIAATIGMLMVAGHTPLVCLLFERPHWQPLIMPALGLLLLAPLWLMRRECTME